MPIRYLDEMPSQISYIEQIPQKAPMQGNVNDTLIPRELRAAAYGVSGAQIPFGNVITSGIGAGIAKAVSPLTGDTRTYKQLYEQAQADTKAVQEASPKSTLVGNALGILSTLPAVFSKPVQGAGVIATPAKGLQNFGNFTSKMASAAPFRGSGFGAGLGNLAARMSGGAAVAAPVGGLYAAGEADAGQRGDAFLKGATTGAAIGGALPLVGAGLGAIGRAVLPKIDDATRELAQSAKTKYGIDLNLNQIAQSKVSNNLQKISQSIPFSGTEANRAKQLGQWNNAVSSTFGQKIDNFTMDAIDDAFVKAGKPFDEILAGKTISVAQKDLDELTQILDDASMNIEPAKVEIVRKNYDRFLSGIKDGTITGEKLNSIRSALTATSKTADAFARPYITKIIDKVVDISTEGNPEVVKKLNEARKNYKNLNIALNAWDSATNSINPVKLENAVKSSSGYGARNYARGRAGDLGELAQIGKKFLPVQGGSDTAPNIITGALPALSLGSLTPFVDPLAGLIATGAMAGNRAIQSGINRNPSVVRKVVESGLTQSAPQITGQGLRALANKQSILNKEK